MKNSSDIIGNRTRDLPDCSAVPQPTAPPRTKKEWRKPYCRVTHSSGMKGVILSKIRGGSQWADFFFKCVLIRRRSVIAKRTALHRK